MASVAILVNGLPGAGKSALGAELAALLGCPLLSKDTLVRSLTDMVGPMIPAPALGAIAMDTMWRMAAAIDAGVVVDAVWLAERDRGFLEAGLATAGTARAVEIWCDIDETEARRRLSERSPSDERGLRFWDEHGANAAPVGVTPVIRVSTAERVDIAELVQEIAAHFVEPIDRLSTPA
ncbi:AAA family ATPase [Curtobacterium ammoniigenes]|uniref:AAA family ATPase n=1 Tax=Curtobacterium ammoniigenes TaxID=395387 RepID=UPI00082A81D0|nr:AAA family ATPase [Curtobacterium ammoniigenes]